MKLRYIVMSMVALTLSVGLVACGDDDDPDDGGAAGSPSAAATTAAEATTEPTEPAEDTPAAGGAGAVTVVAADLSFTPTSFDVTAGEETTVTLDNTGALPHTLTVFSDADYTTAVDGADTDTIAGGDTGEFTVTFDEAGELFFRCTIHPNQMQGTITVQ